MLVEALALGLSELELLGGGLTRAVAAGEGTRTPGSAAADLIETCEQGEGGGVAERNVDHALVHPAAQGGDGGRLLPTAGGGRADEQPEVLAVQGARLPQLTEMVDECLPLGRVVAVAGGDAEEEGVVGLEDVRGDEGDALVLRRRVHLAEHFLWEGLLDSGRLQLVSRRGPT